MRLEFICFSESEMSQVQILFRFGESFIPTKKQTSPCGLVAFFACVSILNYPCSETGSHTADITEQSEFALLF